MVSIPALRFSSLQPAKAKAAFSERAQTTPQTEAEDCFAPRPRFGNELPALETVPPGKTVQTMLARVDFVRNPNPDNRDNIVTKVSDGDTFTIEVKEKENRLVDIFVPSIRKEAIHKETIRLFGTDAQEAPPVLPKNPTPAHYDKIAKIKKLQPYGIAAKEKLEELILEKPVKIYIKEIDNHQRIVAGAKVDLKPRSPGGWVDVAAEMLKSGLVMAYPESAKSAEHRNFIKKRYVPLQADAMAARVGMFRQPNPMPPWVYRRDHKPHLVLER